MLYIGGAMRHLYNFMERHFQAAMERRLQFVHSDK